MRPGGGEDQMDIHFNDTRPAGASAATLFEVITDYSSYPQVQPGIDNPPRQNAATPRPEPGRGERGPAPLRTAVPPPA